MLDWLLDQGADINRTDNRRLDSGFNLAPGETDDSLHLLNNTVASGDIDLFDHLVRRGADTSLCTALHAASRCPDGPTSIAMVRYLLDKHNMDINRDNDDLRHFEHDSQDAGSPLCSAILHKNLTVVHELLARGARVKDDPACSLICYYAAKPGGFLPALEPLLRAGADATQALQQIVSTRNIDAAKACLQFGADPTPALRKAIAQEEYRANTIAENEAYDKAKPQSNYKKSETLIEEEMAEERDSQAMVNLLKSALE
jgi:ankyrin repeat protein